MNTDIESYEFDNLDLEEAVNALDPDERRIIILRLMGFTDAELVKEIGCDRATIWRRVQKIHEKLKKYATNF